MPSAGGFLEEVFHRHMIISSKFSPLFCPPVLDAQDVLDSDKIDEVLQEPLSFCSCWRIFEQARILFELIYIDG